MRTAGWVTGALVAVLAVTLAPACGGGDAIVEQGDAGGDGADDGSALAEAGAGSDVGPTGECSTDTDCVPRLPQTTPPNCADAKCDVLQKKCHFVSKDADHDGHHAKNCSASLGTIETGDDCDDMDPNTYPGAWDGPATDFDAGPNARPDRCDQKDNDCNGTPDDGRLPAEAGTKTCKCDPDKPLPCYEYPNGTAIDPNTLDGNNTPKGACRKGSRDCPGGVPGACLGAVGPTSEQCDNLDHNCNGRSGNGGDFVANAPVWFKDADNDNYGDSATMPVQACVRPAAFWKVSLPNTDCDDNDNTVFPGNPEICDNKDNNCNGVVDEGVKTHYCVDADNDTYCTATCTDACSPPTTYRASNTCGAGLDCNDGVSTIHPNLPELCNGVDDNCINGIDEGWNLGAACTSVGQGVCKRKGALVCNDDTSTKCSAAPGVASGLSSVPSSDPAIDTSSYVQGSYDPVWDWNCDNAIQLEFTPTGSMYTARCQFNNSQKGCPSIGIVGCSANPHYVACFKGADGLTCGQTLYAVTCNYNINTTTCEYVPGSETTVTQRCQ